MKKLTVAVLITIALLIIPTVAFAGVELEFSVDLDGSQEVTPVTTDMTGEFDASIEDGELAFELEVEDNTHEIVAAHIHCAPPGVNGSVGVTLFTGSFTDDEGTLAEGTVTAPDAANNCGWIDLGDVAAAITSGAAYVNVHTSAVPTGEIRGNLPGASLELEAEADLDGAQEVPPVTTDMTGEVEVEIEDGELAFELEVEDNTHQIFAAHIHCAPPGVNGSVGVTLFSGLFTDDEGTLAEGTVTAPDAGNACGWIDLDDVAAAILNGAAYVNVHTLEVPTGEIRGNLN